MRPGLILFCGPSGSGKTTIVKHLLARFPQLSFSISATTRTRRENENDGVDYYFLSEDEFRQKIDQNEFLEWEEVYKSGFYGTLLSEIERIQKEGLVPVFDIDVEGGLNIKKRFGSDLLDVFVVPPSLEELEKRLVARQSEDEESLKKRVNKAAQEITYKERFSKVIIIKNLDDSLAQAERMVMDFLQIDK
jgi:guanylate kinase